MRRLVMLIVAIPALLVLAYWALLFFTQRSLMFPAPPLAGSRPPVGARSVWLELEEGKTEAWYLPPLLRSEAAGASGFSGEGGGGAPLLIFAHGNGELIDYWPDEFDEPRASGLAVLLVEYPGYGRSEGRPSRDSIQRAFEAAFDWASDPKRQPEVDRTRIIGYGRSIGGAAVCDLSRSRPLAALVLESSFTSTRAFAAGMFAPGFLIRDRWDNQEAVAAFASKGLPILVLHGDRDRIIPTEHGRQLAAAAGVELRLLPCGHNDCPRAWGLLSQFLDQSGIWPKRIVDPAAPGSSSG